MAWQDNINGLYECVAGAAILLNCRRMCIDKELKGVSVLATVFFTSWGYWNLYYYPHLGQWMSFVGGCFLVGANTLWLGMIGHYSGAFARWRIRYQARFRCTRCGKSDFDAAVMACHRSPCPMEEY